MQEFVSGNIRVINGDCLDVMAALYLDGARVDSIVCDPPYHLTSIVKRFGKADSAPCVTEGKAADSMAGAYARASKGFMGKAWDGGDIAFKVRTWKLAFDLLKPGGHLIAFSGTRTYHRMAMAIEEAGFEIRDQLAWCYGTGFPKSHDIAKNVDKLMGGVRAKVRVPVDMVRNPKSINGGHEVEGGDRPWMERARVVGYHEKDGDEPATDAARAWEGWGTALKPAWEPMVLARKPLSEASVAANVLKHGTGAINVDACRVGDPIPHQAGGLHRGSGSTVGAFTGSTDFDREDHARWPANVVHDGSDEVVGAFEHFISGAARFFYSAKADADDRMGSKHPTVKPADLMAWCVRLVTPPTGVVLDLFAGSGSTGIGALREGIGAILIEREAEYFADIRTRLEHARGQGAHSAAVKARGKDKSTVDLPLFGGEAAE